MFIYQHILNIKCLKCLNGNNIYLIYLMVEHLTDLWNGCIIINKTESVKKILKKIFPHISANVNNLGDFNPTLFRGK